LPAHTRARCVDVAQLHRAGCAEVHRPVDPHQRGAGRTLVGRIERFPRDGRADPSRYASSPSLANRDLVQVASCSQRGPGRAPRLQLLCSLTPARSRVPRLSSILATFSAAGGAFGKAAT
jgi:hypothetical protein